jgi:hypothetical protein
MPKSRFTYKNYQVHGGYNVTGTPHFSDPGLLSKSQKLILLEDIKSDKVLFTPYIPVSRLAEH